MHICCMHEHNSPDDFSGRFKYWANQFFFACVCRQSTSTQWISAQSKHLMRAILEWWTANVWNLSSYISIVERRALFQIGHKRIKVVCGVSMLFLIDNEMISPHNCANYSVTERKTPSSQTRKIRALQVCTKKEKRINLIILLGSGIRIGKTQYAQPSCGSITWFIYSI